MPVFLILFCQFLSNSLNGFEWSIMSAFFGEEVFDNLSGQLFPLLKIVSIFYIWQKFVTKMEARNIEISGKLWRDHLPNGLDKF